MIRDSGQWVFGWLWAKAKDWSELGFSPKPER
jgi:hypothetical protein